MQILNYANSDANAPNTDTPTSDSFERNKRVKKKKNNPKNENEIIKLKSNQYLRNIHTSISHIFVR